MSLFGPFIHKNKDGEKFFLHMSQKGERKLYYFSKDPRGALNSLPSGFEVFENEDSGLPMLRKKEGGFLGGILGKSSKKEESKA
ncbi:MAG: hypothetical protein GF368_00125 [Candidatus Aenigmarchaeota archaeon]|nr:hypothetical protein [Candidatus Aenigmarchaeota archaeon]